MAMGFSKFLQACLTVLVVVFAQDGQDEFITPGNVVEGRDVPPARGCTASGMAYLPLAPQEDAQPMITNSWDWCQYYCKTTTVLSWDSRPVACAHFAFYPDGRCFLQDDNVTLAEAPSCNITHPCEHGFKVVSGPPNCSTLATWVYPPVAKSMEEVSLVERSSTSVPAVVATTAAVRPEASTTAVPAVVDELPSAATAVEPQATAATVVSDAAPAAVSVIPVAGPTVEEEVPAGATVVGYFYKPTEKAAPYLFLEASTWGQCLDLCRINLECKYWVFWPSGKCQQLSSDPVLVKAGCSDAAAVCEELGVRSGPGDVSNKALWPTPAELGKRADARKSPTPGPSIPRQSSIARHDENGWDTFFMLVLGGLVAAVGGRLAHQRNLCCDLGGYGSDDSEADPEADNDGPGKFKAAE